MSQVTEQMLSVLPGIRKTNLEAQMVIALAQRLGISTEEALERYYSSSLSALVEENRYGLQYLDAEYLVEELLRMEEIR